MNDWRVEAREMICWTFFKRLLLREQTIEEKRGNKKNRQEAVEIVHKRGAAAWDSHAGGGYDVK